MLACLHHTEHPFVHEEGARAHMLDAGRRLGCWNPQTWQGGGGVVDPDESALPISRWCLRFCRQRAWYCFCSTVQYNAGMAEEIRRRKTSDPEMDAMLVIAQAMEPLDRAAAQRVLQWARDRYVEIRLPGLELDQMKGVGNFMEAVGKTASRIGMASGIELLKAMDKVADELPAEGEHVPA